MAAKKKSSSVALWPVARFVLIAGVWVCAGYLWRSYFPVPVSFSPALSGSDTAEAEARELSLKDEMAKLLDRIRNAELDLSKLRQPAAPEESPEVKQAEDADRALRELLTASTP